jgi:hypothetical protein
MNPKATHRNSCSLVLFWWQNIFINILSVCFVAVLNCTCPHAMQVQRSTATKEVEMFLVNMFFVSRQPVYVSDCSCSCSLSLCCSHVLFSSWSCLVLVLARVLFLFLFLVMFVSCKCDMNKFKNKTQETSKRKRTNNSFYMQTRSATNA